MKQYIRKADIILFIVLIAVGLAASAVLSLSGSGAVAGSKVVIESGGSIFATYSLDKDITIDVPASSGSSALSAAASGNSQAGSGDENGSAGEDGSVGEDGSAAEDDKCTQYDSYNTVRIKDGKVSVTEASCKNQVCVKHAAISAAGESIVCLPNRLVVSIEGSGEGGGYDTITS